jgi:Rieske Fe-S protein
MPPRASTAHQSEDVMKNTRREFCVHSCELLSLAAVGSILEGCGGGSPTSPSSTSSVPLIPSVQATVANGAVVLIIDSSSPLSTVGSALLIQTSSDNVLAARTAQDSFVALTAICTHEGCTITGYQSQVYTCPCHGSQYSTNGQVLKGPALRSLRQFATQFANNTLTITL